MLKELYHIVLRWFCLILSNSYSFYCCALSRLNNGHGSLWYYNYNACNLDEIFLIPYSYYWYLLRCIVFKKAPISSYCAFYDFVFFFIRNGFSFLVNIFFFISVNHLSLTLQLIFWMGWLPKELQHTVDKSHPVSRFYLKQIWTQDRGSFIHVVYDTDLQHLI